MSLLTKSFHGLSGGINQAFPAWELPDTQAVWIQDALLDVPGVVRRRGVIRDSGAVTYPLANATLPQGMCQATLPDNSIRVAFLHGTASPKLRILNQGFTASTGWDWPGNWASFDPVYTARPALNGGVMVGAAEDYTPTATGGLALWLGASRNKYTDGTITSTRGSTTVTASGTLFTSSNADVGQFVVANDGGTTYTLIGVIASVTDDTTLELQEPALATVAGSAYALLNIRGIVPRCIKGRVTVADTTPTVVGAGTKFNMMNDGNTWELFRLSDMAWIGTVSSVESDTALTLTANAAVALANDHFVGIRVTGTNLYNSFDLGGAAYPGWINCIYANRQFYANNPIQDSSTPYASRVWFSDPNDPEGLDMSPTDGDFFDVASTGGSSGPVTALVPLQNALAIFKEKELYLLSGSDPSTFQLRKIANVGALNGMAAVTYKNQVIFASRDGIFAFDGVSLSELSSNLGDYWRRALLNFDAAEDRIYAFIYRDHYFVHISDFESDYSPTKGIVAQPITEATFALNLTSGAFSYITNFGFKGAEVFTSGDGRQGWYIIRQDDTDITTIGSLEDFWDYVGPDEVISYGQTLGPDFYIETKKFDMGDPGTKKFFKQLIMIYELVGDSLSMDTVPGLGDTGTTTTQKWLPQSDWITQRIKFMKRASHIGFRIYETNGNVNFLKIGPWNIGFSWQRPGRV